MEAFARADALRREYARLARHYDERWAAYIAETRERTLRCLDARPDGSVLDVGCGTGALLEALARRVPAARLIGVDLSLEMLAVARRKLPPNVALVHGRAECLPFASGRFDTVVSSSSFHFWREPIQALREMARVLRPGGRVVITDWCADYFWTRTWDFWLRWRNHYVSKAYRGSELAGALEQAGFVRIHIERFKINWFWGLMTATAHTQRSDGNFGIKGRCTEICGVRDPSAR